MCSNHVLQEWLPSHNSSNYYYLCNCACCVLLGCVGMLYGLLVREEKPCLCGLNAAGRITAVTGLAAHWDILRQGCSSLRWTLNSPHHTLTHGLCVSIPLCCFIALSGASEASAVHFISISAGQVCWAPGAPPAWGERGSSTKLSLTGRWLCSVRSWTLKQRKLAGATSLASKVVFATDQSVRLTGGM